MTLNKVNKTLIICIIFISGLSSTFLESFLYYGLILIGLASYFLYKRTISVRFVSVCITVGIFSVLYPFLTAPKADKLSFVAPMETMLKGRIVSRSVDSIKSRAKLELDVSAYQNNSEKWTETKAKTLVFLYDKEKKFDNITVGKEIELSGKLFLPNKATNPAQFDYKKYLNNQGIFTLFYSKADNINVLKHVQGVKWRLIAKLEHIKEKIINVHNKYINSPYLEVLGGMVFGDYAVPTPDDIKKNFINSGLLHLLAASGMNVGLIYGGWYLLSRVLFVPFRSSIMIGGVIVFIYALMTGMPPSVERAMFMLEFILLAKLIDRKADNIVMLALVCTIMLLFNPFLLVDIGFQLSFLVTFGLLFCMPVFTEKLSGFYQAIAGVVLVPIIAQLWAMPIQLYHFNTFSPYSILANILVIPFVSIVSITGFIGSFFALIPVVGEKICQLSDIIAKPFIILILKISEVVAGLPDSILYFATPNKYLVIIFFLLVVSNTLFIKLSYSKKKMSVFALAFLIVLTFLFLPKSASKNFEMLFFDVGQADSTLIKTPDNSYILVDTGDTGKRNFNSAKNVIIPYLQEKGIGTIDLIVLTHPDSDHIGGTVDILEKVNANMLIDNGEKAETKIFKKIEKYLIENKINRKHLLNSRQIYNKNNLKIFAIRPNSFIKDDNEQSIILYICYKDFSALLMGDSEVESLDLIKKHVKSSITILKVGHHGSFNSVNDDFLNYLKPENALISVGKNDYHLPNDDTLILFKDYKIPVLRTDKDFAVKVITDGKKTQVKTYFKDKF